MIPAATLALLACPVCQGALAEQPAHLLCQGCGRCYPVVDGIPVLLAERAEQGCPAPASAVQ